MFVPQCTGSLETITQTSRASQYSDVTLSSDTQYLFQSNVSSDYITITNIGGTAVLAKGSSPLTWNSGSFAGPVRYYIHTQVACGGFESSTRWKSMKCTPYCNAPSNLAIYNKAAKSVYLTWKNGAATAYQPYITTSAATPDDNLPTAGNTVTDNFYTFTGLTPATTYYLWVRSVCPSGNSAWVSGGSFTTFAGGCNVGDLYPNATFTPTCTSAPEVITTHAWAGEDSAVALLANKTYTFASSVATDYITITNVDYPLDTVYAFGTTPLTWNTGAFSGTVRFFIHTDADCGTQDVDRTRTVMCIPPPVCLVPSALTVANITSNSAKVSWTVPSQIPSDGYDIYYSTSSTPPTASQALFDNFNATTYLLRNLNSNATYYYWIRSNCGDLKSAWVGGTFNTIAFQSCNGAYAGLWPADNFTPTCNGTDVISATALPSTFSNINVIPNKQYTFSSSVSTDYITVTNADGTVVYATGATPVTWGSCQ
ncbi:fibronectin type III domain-containing protein [Flavobacterium sp. 3HN19-14]|uniref:fibronectin type III domain-containing protein n=1 Tax=Flavobacterium sp. 3HN19-14 TaxID=3448133 RepID=UPI003EE10DCE